MCEADAQTMILTFLFQVNGFKGHKSDFPFVGVPAQFAVEGLPPNRSDITEFVPVCNLLQNVSNIMVGKG